MSRRVEAAQRQAANYLKEIEKMARLHSQISEDCAEFGEVEAAFKHLSQRVQDRYGAGGHLSVGLIMMGVASLCYFQGKVHEDDFQGLRADLREMVDHLLEFTVPIRGALH